MLKLYIDLEVRAPRFISPEEASMPVSSISVLMDDESSVVRTFVLSRSGRLRRYRLRIPGGREFRIVAFPVSTETSLLSTVASLIRSADCLLGWNIKGYDLPYLMSRMRRLHLDVSSLSPLGNARISRRDGEPIIEGVNILDLQRIYTEVNARTLYTSLDRASREVLGFGKLGRARDVHRMSEEELIIYNAGDVILTYLIDEKLKLSDFSIELSRESFRPIAESYAKSQIVDSTLLAFARRRGVVLPTRRSYKRSRYEGAIVFDPIVGLHRDVLIADFKRMYPSIIINFNLSPETVVSPDTPVEKIVFNVNGRRIAVRQDVKGLVPAYLEDLFKLRDRYEEILAKLDPHDPLYEVYKQKRQIVKDTINSVYGQFAYAGDSAKGIKGSRIFNLDLAILTTYLERVIITLAMRIANRLGYRVLYGDTDSIFITCKGLREYEDITNTITSILNEELERMYGKKFNLVLEPKEHFIKVLLYKKKRYVGLVDWKDGEEISPPLFEVKGFELVRTDTPKITRDMQERFFRLLLEFGYDEVLVKAFIDSMYERFRRAKLEEIAVPTVIHKLNYKVRNVQAKAVESARKLGIDVYVGKRLFWLYLRGGDIIAVDEENLDLLERFRDQVDIRKMFERNVLQKISQILEIFRSGGGQMRLFESGTA